MQEEKDYGPRRRDMVEEIAAYAILASDRIGKMRLDERVMAAMDKVPRHAFVPFELRDIAYENTPLPIGHDTTISQPFINAYLMDLLEIAPSHDVLEIGTGLGYQAALLAELAGRVYTVEIVEALAIEAEARLARLGYDTVEIHCADGAGGWLAHAPYDRILVTAAPELIPPPLLGQLKPGGRMVVPAGLANSQHILLVTRDEDGRITTSETLPVGFGPLHDPEGEHY